ncbi:MAG TPA: polyketide synthase dehydratase domain-containing protein, partial [Nevskiaceae bacterium]|nr:polyketide synthase dehydratase domain-containing protein [Nevskiaceae bacterium]
MSIPVVAVQDAPARYPLLGNVTERSEQRLTIERTLDLASDLFLRDHTIGSAPSAHDPNLLPIPVLPFTFSMEIMAEAGACLLARDDLRLIGLEQCRGSRWLSLDDGRLPLRITAERITAREGVERISGRIYVTGANAPAGGVLVFEATALYAVQYPQPPAAKPWSSPDQNPARNNPDGELYKHGMFHGPRLQGVTHLRRWGEQSIEADLATIPTHDYFSFTPSPQFQFDAALLDAAGQLAGYWLTEKHTWGFNCFPYRVGNLKLYAPPPRAGSHVLCRAQLGFTDEHLLEAHFDLIGSDGQLIMRADRWEDRKFTMPARLYEYRLKPQERYLAQPWLAPTLPAGYIARRIEPFANQFLDEGGGIWKRMLAHMVLNQQERARYYLLPAAGPRREEWLMGRIAAKEALRDWALREHGMRLASADFEIASDELGRPFATCAQLPGRTLPAVSISHSRQWAVALLAPAVPRVGIDYQRLAGLDAALLEAGAFADDETR